MKDIKAMHNEDNKFVITSTRPSSKQKIYLHRAWELHRASPEAHSPWGNTENQAIRFNEKDANTILPQLQEEGTPNTIEKLK